MKKGWVIGSVMVVVICLIAGSLLFQQRVEETSQELEVDETSKSEDANEIDELDVVTDEEKSTEHNGNTASAATVDDEEENNKEEAQRGSDQVKEADRATSNSSSSSETSKKESTTSTGSQGQKETDENKPGSSNRESSSNEDSATVEAQSVTAIKNEYYPEFQQLEWEQSGKLDALVQKAFNDYMSDSKSFNAEKYRSQAAALESAADASFYQKYNQLQAELAANGHSKQAAAEFEQSYQAKKAARESDLKSLMNNY